MHRQSARVPSSCHRLGNLYRYVLVSGARASTSRMDTGLPVCRVAKSGLPLSQPGRNGPPVSLALGGHRSSRLDWRGSPIFGYFLYRPPSCFSGNWWLLACRGYCERKVDHRSPSEVEVLLRPLARHGPTRLLKLLKLSLLEFPALRGKQVQLTRLILGLDKIAKLLFSYTRARLKSSAPRRNFR